MPQQVTFKGNPLTLVGRRLNLGENAPDFRVSALDLKGINLNNFKDKIKVINSFPSLDTPVCDLQVKEFNKRAAGLNADVVIIGISKDLPFAQSRFCSMNEIKNETVLSDYKYSSFGLNYGLLIKELNLLARAVIILDKNNIVRYIEIVPEVTSAVNFNRALAALEEVMKSPQVSLKQDLPSKCKPCEEGAKSLPKEKIEKLLAKYHGWELVEDKKLIKEFKFKDFVEAKYFLDLISIIAEEQGHHPTLTIIYNKLKVELTTHAAGGLTENDFIMAKIIDDIGN